MYRRIPEGYSASYSSTKYTCQGVSVTTASTSPGHSTTSRCSAYAWYRALRLERVFNLVIFYLVPQMLDHKVDEVLYLIMQDKHLHFIVVTGRNIRLNYLQANVPLTSNRGDARCSAIKIRVYFPAGKRSQA